MPDVNSPETEKITPEANVKEDNLPKIRTFKSDAQRYIEKHKPSIASIAAERVDRGEISPERFQTKFFNKKQFIIFGAIGLVIIGLAIAAVFIFLPAEQPQETAIQPPNPLIPAEEEEIIKTKEGDRASIILAIQGALASRHPRKSLLNMPILEEKEAGQRTFLETRDFFRVLQIPVPPELFQTLESQMLLGVFSGNNQLDPKNNSLVLMFKIASFEDAFAAMLDWEKSIVRDIAAILPRYLNRDTGNEIFRDQVIKNQDARYIINLEKSPILFYTMINRKVLLITTSQEVLEEMTERLVLSFP